MSWEPQATDLSEDLTKAAMWGNLKLLESLLENGADPNFPNGQGNSALHEAAYYGETECASVLLSFKASVNAPGADGKTPLHKAVCGTCVQVPGEKYDSETRIQENQMNIVRLLVAHGADLNITDDSGLTPRDMAMQCDFYDCADLLDELEQLQAKVLEDKLKETRVQGLFGACESGNLETLKELLPYAMEAINDFLGGREENLFICAARNGHLKLVEYLLSQGAVAVASPTTNKTALHFACEEGHTDIVVCLLNCLPALLAIDDSPKETSLHIAARKGHVEIVKNLLAVAARSEVLKSADSSTEPNAFLTNTVNERIPMNESLPEMMMIDVMARSVKDQRTPLHEAAAYGHTEIVKLLVNYLREYSSPKSHLSTSPGPFGSGGSAIVGGFSPRHTDTVSTSLLGNSPTSGGTKKGTVIVPGIDILTLRGKTAFHEASKQGHFETMEVLLQSGADINAYIRPSLAEDVNVELTALVQACLMNRLDVVRFLLRHGATDARLKALTRTLRVPNNEIAGVLLCYNGGVQQVPTDIRTKKKASAPTDVCKLNVSWNSKNLKYICKDWLEMTIMELPSLSNKSCVLSTLDISSNQLSELPIEVFQLPHLSQLDFSRNQIKYFPLLPGKTNSGWTCSKLTQIDATANQLTQLPSCLFTLSELKEISANKNKVFEVPATVWSAPKLQRLTLAHNQLSSFPSTRNSSESLSSMTPWDNSVASPLDYTTQSPPGGVPMQVPNYHSPPIVQSDSGYQSDPRYGRGGSISLVESPIQFPLPYSTGKTPNIGSLEPRAQTIQTKAMMSRRLESFHDMDIEVEEFDDLETTEEGDSSEVFMLEVLDLAHNSLSAIPAGLSCLAPKLQKLNVAHNRIKSLGSVSDFPVDLDQLDASSNDLHTAIAPSIPGSDHRYYQPCGRRHFEVSTSLTMSTIEGSSSTPSFQNLFKPCPHRSHKNLRKLSTLKLNNNHLVDLQLFRFVGRSKGSTDLTSSFEESTKPSTKLRSNTVGEHHAVVVNNTSSPRSATLSGELFNALTKSFTSRRATVGKKNDLVKTPSSGDDSTSHHAIENGKSPGSSNSNSSQEGSGSGATQTVSVVISPLFPQLSTLEVSKNRLRHVPSHLHLMTNIACLVISHNKDIDTLPLELSNLEHLWNLEYDGCPLTNPPAEDLDKFRLASDKLLYMRSLLHDAKPNESMKLMLVGLQRMGKTTLLSRLREVHEKATPSTTFMQRVTGEDPPAVKRGKRTDTLSTVGVDVGIWKYRKDLDPDYLKIKKRGSKPMRSVTFYTWDFGGQEEYYVTHQCFLSTRSLYLAVWDVMKGESGIEELGPWLHNIQARAPDSPVVIVGTHCDKLKSDERDKRKKELNHVIYQKYLIGRGPQQLKEMGLPKILDVIYVGCPLNGRPEGIPELRMALYDISFSLTAPGRIGHGPNKTKLLDQPIPASFLKLQERVQQLVAQCRSDDLPPLLKETIFRESVQDIIANPRELDQAVKFLHENGIMLHYDTPALSHLYFTDPQWLCDMLAHVVTVPEVNRFIQRSEGPEAGILRTSVLSHVFKGNIFPQAHRKEYIELLGKFEVALYLDRHRLLVPSMLPLKPAYTIHTFSNVFPRPNLCQILATSPETSRLFGRDHSTSSKSQRDTQPSKLAVATHVSEDLFRTGFVLRRFYFMTYVPSGFWPRLISRFLASTDISGVVLKSLGNDDDMIAEISEQIVSGELGSGVSLEWSYWKTGIELWYKGLSLLRVTEILPGGSFKNCKPSPSIFEQSSSVPIEPCLAADDLSFELNGSWMPVDMTPNRGIEILVADAVCLAMLYRELEEARSASSPYSGASPDPRVESCDQPTTSYPSYESHWMSAEIFSLAVDYIDTLLEDWYPGLGGRDGNTTMEAIPYVNRVIPCPFCVSGATPLPEPTPTDLQVFHAQSVVDGSDQLNTSAPKQDAPISSDMEPSPLVSKQKGSKYSRQNSGGALKAKRALFNGSGGINNKDSSDSGIHHVSTGSTFQPSSSEQPPSTNTTTSRQSTRKGSLADIYRTHQAANIENEPLAIPLESIEKTANAEMGLTLASKFGFMFESCIISARQFEPLVCPAHRDHPLPIRDIAPDLIFADLPSCYVLNPDCVDMGEYIDHGTFGDIYHGTVYPTPSATDDEGREVAIKIDRLDSKLFTAESASKAYIEVRAEVSILHRLHHPNVIEFIGVVLQPLCFILEWAHGGSLSSVFQKYRKVDARIAPMVLQNTAYQVASGLAYMHKHKIVYYDLKSPNILVFKFPSAQESLQVAQGHEQSHDDDGDEELKSGELDTVSQVHVKIADLGISQALSPGGVMGFKGSPGFMAPEILKYVGTEACTEKVDIFSYAMFLYEMISLYFPFEKQNLMGSQIEKLVTEGERPPLQSRELNNPILYLDVMRWCWQQDFRNRPSADQLTGILTNPSISRLVDARCLHHSNTVTCACICTLPIEVVPPTELTDPDQQSFVPLTSTPHSYVTRGDLQEELWLCTHSESGSEVCVINFKEKSAQSFPVCSSVINSICCVSYTMWLGTEEGQVFILDAVSKHTLLDRHLAVLSGQGICGIYYLLTNRQVLVARKDGCILLFNETIEETKLPDDSCYDNRLNGTQLPVRSVFKTPEKLPILCSTIVHYPAENRKTIWCGTKHEILLVFDVLPSQIQYCRKKYNRSRYDTLEEDCVASITRIEEECDGHVTSYVWALSRPGNVFYCWNANSEQLLTTVNIDQFITDEVSSLHAMGSQLQLALTTGQIVLLNVKATEIMSSMTLTGHVKNVYQTLSIGGRILPRHWLPSIIGRSNAIDFYKDLVDEKDVKAITSAMIGHQTRLLVTIGYGYRGLADRLVEPLMSPKDYEENFVLLWTTDR